MSSSLCTDYLKVCGQMAENPEGVATKRCREEGKNVGTVVTGTDVGGVDGWDMDV